MKIRNRKIKSSGGGTNFHVPSKKLVIFDKAPWESPVPTNLIQKTRNKHLENEIFCLAPLAPVKRM